MLDRLNYLLDFGEALLKKPINLHVSSGLVGRKAFFADSPTQAEILLSIPEIRTAEELEALYLKCLAHLQVGTAEETEKVKKVLETLKDRAEKGFSAWKKKNWEKK